MWRLDWFADLVPPVNIDSSLEEIAATTLPALGSTGSKGREDLRNRLMQSVAPLSIRQSDPDLSYLDIGPDNLRLVSAV